jgi:hypothetical protein
MAQIVVAVGTSHGPSIQSDPEKWARLGARDAQDPRMDYQALLRAAKPGLDVEITLDVQRQRHASVHAALRQLTMVIAQAKPDVLLVVSNLHRPAPADSHPVFGILRAERFAITKLSERLFDANAKQLQTGVREPAQIVAERPGHPALATHLVESLIEDGFDMACMDRLPESGALDDAFSFPYEWLLGGADIPVVPFMLSRDLPNQATPSRCYDLGIALRRQIERWPAAARVGLIASGGFSHQIVDEDLDRMVAAALVDGDEAALRHLPRARLNRAPGTPEILNWVTVAAAMAPTRMTLVDYQPCYRSLGGTGHGLAFGHWAC